jgi:hypothetical protein
MDYAWAITNIKKGDVANLSDVVIHVRWTLTGTDTDGDSGTFQGATPLDPPVNTQGTFTAYEDLTEQQVIAWIQAVVVGSYKDHIDGQIAKQIAAIKAPVTEVEAKALPWAPPPEPEDAINEPTA